MLKIALVAATDSEIGAQDLPGVTPVVTGIGSVNTAYSLTKHLASGKFDLVLNVGICGSFRRDIPLGSVVLIDEEIFADLGASNADGQFLDLKALGFPLFHDETEIVYNSLVNPNKTETYFRGDVLPKICGKGITVNNVTGDEASIASVMTRCAPDFESMEGAAAALVCRREKIPYFEFRAVSNYVEPRNRENWRIKEALTQLHNFIPKLLGGLKT